VASEWFCEALGDWIPHVINGGRPFIFLLGFIMRV
jgi:hypothetical protein